MHVDAAFPCHIYAFRTVYWRCPRFICLPIFSIRRRMAAGQYMCSNCAATAIEGRNRFRLSRVSTCWLSRSKLKFGIGQYAWLITGLAMVNGIARNPTFFSFAKSEDRTADIAGHEHRAQSGCSGNSRTDIQFSMGKQKADVKFSNRNMSFRAVPAALLLSACATQNVATSQAPATRLRKRLLRSCR